MHARTHARRRAKHAQQYACSPRGGELAGVHVCTQMHMYRNMLHNTNEDT